MGYFWVDLPTTESGVGDSAVIYSTVDCILTTSAHETVQNVSLRKYNVHISTHSLRTTTQFHMTLPNSAGHHIVEG